MSDIDPGSEMPLDIEGTSASAKDRSDGGVMFSDVLQAERRKHRPKNEKPVRLNLSEAAKKYARKLDTQTQQNKDKKTGQKRRDYPKRSPRAQNPPLPPDSESAETDGGDRHD
jgi:hypothetical protein